ncbi:ECF-type sigma factor [Tautonia marina]|uniref:ECF-type sigma factor n=1 Tax=Tautonia marina TaxID=2653855 RepID=UPI0012607678|nr:ECF-type sigma factor [Tautonia marina]
MEITSETITTLLARIESGDNEARDALLTVAYDELKLLAADLMRGERAGHTLQPTALLHEAMLRVQHHRQIGQGRGRSYFFAVMVGAMRRVLVDHARARQAARRGGTNAQRVPLDAIVDAVEQDQHLDLIDLDDALQRLASWNPRQAEVVTLRYFGGWTIAEIANHLLCSVSLIEKDWRLARAWLARQLGDGES